MDERKRVILSRKIFPNSSIVLRKELYGYVVDVYVGKVLIFSRVEPKEEVASSLYDEVKSNIENLFNEASLEVKNIIINGGKENGK